MAAPNYSPRGGNGSTVTTNDGIYRYNNGKWTKIGSVNQPKQQAPAPRQSAPQQQAQPQQSYGGGPPTSGTRQDMAMGANVGDYRDFGGQKYRWNGVQWEMEGGGGGGAPSAQSLIDPYLAKLQEQVSFLKDFVAQNPTYFDEQLARKMAGDKYKAYYTELLNDYVNPLRDKIARSTQDEAKVLTELARQKQFGELENKTQTEKQLEQTGGQLAESQLLGSGIGNRAMAQKKIAAQTALEDFIAKNKLQSENTSLQAGRERGDYQTQIGLKERDIFGSGREYDAKVAQDVESQRGVSQKQYGLRVQDALTSRFGNSLINIPDYLRFS